jgi:hypothetical protein
MIKNGMNGKCFNVIKSMYQNIKSCVAKNGVNSDCFSCSIGSVKGETYPPACEGEIRLISSANEFNRLFNILVKTLLKQLSRLIGL